MNAQIELLENDIRRASAQVKKYQEAGSTITLTIYQNILDKLEKKLREMKNV